MEAHSKIQIAKDILTYILNINFISKLMKNMSSDILVRIQQFE